MYIDPVNKELLNGFVKQAENFMSNQALTFNEFKGSKYSGRPHYFVIGHPISHSLSPIMHNLSLQHYGVNARYFAIDLKPQSVNDFISWMNRDAFLGCNITIPYKKQLLNVPDLLSAEAESVGAINTISKDDSGTQLTGHNTDIYGFQQPLLEYDDHLDYGRAIVFGSGGASLAVQFALADLGFEDIVIVSRSPMSVEPLKGAHHTTVVDYSQWQSYSDEACLIVNTTPIGMGKFKLKSVIEDREAHLLSEKVCYDLVYNPLKTKFLQQAETGGGIAVNGLDMLISQGSRSHEIWTGRPFPHNSVKSELLTFFES